MAKKQSRLTLLSLLLVLMLPTPCARLAMFQVWTGERPVDLHERVSVTQRAASAFVENRHCAECPKGVVDSVPSRIGDFSRTAMSPEYALPDHNGLSGIACSFRWRPAHGPDPSPPSPVTAALFLRAPPFQI